MSAGLLLFRKEMLEYARNYKWVWIPLVFLLLGLMEPISTYYMPQILKAGGVAEEAAKLIPVPTSKEIMAESLSQYGTLGLLVLALSFMGTVAGERQSGSAIMVLVKPVSHASYITAKWCAMALLTLASVGLGQLGAWYYTNVLFERVSFYDVGFSCLVYVLWLLFVNTVTLLLSCLLKSNGAIAFLSLGIAAAISTLTYWLGDGMKWSPGRLTAEAGRLLLGENSGDHHLWLPVGVTAAAIIALLLGAVAASKRMWVKA